MNGKQPIRKELVGNQMSKILEQNAIHNVNSFLYTPYKYSKMHV